MISVIAARLGILRLLMCVVGIAIAIWAGASFMLTELAWSHAESGSVPSEVLQATWRFRFLHPYIRGSQGGQTLEEEYASWFFDGYLCGHGCRTENATTLETEAYSNGASIRSAHPESIDRIMSGFGYRQVNVVGTWTRMLEHSVFTERSKKEETWFLIPVASEGEQTNGSHLPWGDSTVRVIGYLSPARKSEQGKYRELRAISITAFPQ